MKKIKIKATDLPSSSNGGSLGEKFDIMYVFLKALEKNYEVEFSDDPDYIFCFCPINGADGIEYTKYPNAVRIQVAQESVRPEFNVFDYCIGMFPEIISERYFYIPGPMLLGEGIRNGYELMRKKHIFLNEKEMCNRKFCSFLVSNGNGALERTDFFNLLNSLKKVDSGGGYLNNIGYRVPDKLVFEKEHKFSIAFENVYYSCTTEKIVMAFAAQTVPIYWGNPDITNMYNRGAFVNCHDFDSFDEVIDYVKQIDEDDDLYLRMLRTPALLKDKSIEQYENELADYLKKIIETPKDRAIIRTNVEWSGFMENIRKYGMRHHMKEVKRTNFIACHTPKFLKRSNFGQIMKEKILRRL